MNLNAISVANTRYLQIFSFSFKGAGEIVLTALVLFLSSLLFGFVNEWIGLWAALIFVWVGQTALIGVPMLILVLLGRFDRR